MSTASAEQERDQPTLTELQPATSRPTTSSDAPPTPASSPREASSGARKRASSHKSGQGKRRYARRKITPRSMALTIDTLMPNTISTPMTALQTKLLEHMKTSLPPNTLTDYYDISVAFKDFVRDEVTSMDRLSRLLLKGGNAFFNHFMFTSYWGKDWKYTTDDDDMLLYQFDRTDWRGVHLASLCYPHTYRLMYRYVIIRALDHAVLVRGDAWYNDPHTALCSAKETRSNAGQCIDKGSARTIVMLESLCRCLVHQPYQSSVLMCRCCEDFDFYKKNTYFM